MSSYARKERKMKDEGWPGNSQYVLNGDSICPPPHLQANLIHTPPPPNPSPSPYPIPRNYIVMQRQDPLQSPFVPFSPNPSLQQGTPTATAPLKHSLTASQSSNLRYSSSRKSIYDRHLNRTQRSELSKSSFAFLFGEMVQYAQKRVSGIQDLEKKSATPPPFVPTHVSLLDPVI